MNDIAVSRSRIPAKFRPQDAKVTDAKLDALIDYGKRIKDWPLVERAVDEKIEQQAEFVQWWRQNVTIHHGAGRGKKISGLKSFSSDKAEELTGITGVQVSRWAKRLTDRPKYRERMLLAAFRGAELAAAENHRAEGTGENEWYTPIKYVEAARTVMGGIDLDPATSVVAQRAIQAEKFYTKKDNGLNHEWHGRVWLNPPYAQPAIWDFCDKLVKELSEGNATEAILLTHNYTDTAWFHHAESIAAAVCFTRGRIAFIDSDGEPCAPTQGQAFFYYGENTHRFSDEFKQFGFVR